MILTYPDNPTGLSYKPEELKALAAVARKHRLIVISDEIYGKVHFEASTRASPSTTPRAPSSARAFRSGQELVDGD